MGGSRLVNRNITAGCGRTSMRLEPEVWDALRELCLRENIELRDLIRTVEARSQAGGRTSAVRVHVLKYYREAATEDGHAAAGHGAGTSGGLLHIRSEIEIDVEPPLAGLNGVALEDGMLGETLRADETETDELRVE